MQTFLPYADFEKSAYVLDRSRLGKQRLECIQILENLYGVSKGWKNHPAVKMWKYHDEALFEYTLAIIKEWKRRGYKDTREEVLHNLYSSQFLHGIGNPWWLGNEKFHASHRSNLLRKMPNHYMQFNWSESNDIPYWWPESGTTIMYDAN